MIVLGKCYYKDMLHHCFNELPNEACGLLAGRIEHGQKSVEKVYFLTNVDHSPEHFSMDPKEQLSAVKNMRANGWVLLGNFHSHPATPARPSQEDIRLAFDPTKSYLIMSLMDKDKVVLKGFNIVNQQVSTEELIIGGE